MKFVGCCWLVWNSDLEMPLLNTQMLVLKLQYFHLVQRNLVLGIVDIVDVVGRAVVVVE